MELLVFPDLRRASDAAALLARVADQSPAVAVRLEPYLQPNRLAVAVCAPDRCRAVVVLRHPELGRLAAADGPLMVEAAFPLEGEWDEAALFSRLAPHFSALKKK